MNNRLISQFLSINISKFVLFFSVVLASCILIMPVLKFRAFHTSFFDLGQYSTLAFQIASKADFGLLVRGHANLFLFLYACLYRIYPSPVTLFLLQSLSILVSAFICAKYCKSKIDSDVALPVFLLLLSTPVWYNALCGFHFEHLLFLFIPLFFYVADIEHGNWRTFFLISLALSICCVKEVYALSASMLGVYLIIRHRQFGLGTLIFIMSLFYFFIMSSWVIPYFTDGRDIGAIWYRGFGYLGNNMQQIIVTLLHDPLLIFRELFCDWHKLFYVCFLFGIFVFITVLSPLELLPALPLLVISILSHNSNHYAYGNQYTAGVYATLFVAFIVALSKVDNARLRSVLFVSAILSSLVILIAIGPAPVSRLFWNGKIWNYEANAYKRTESDAIIAKMIKENVPANPEIAVSVQNTLITKRITNRKYLFAFPEGIFEPAHMPDWRNHSMANWITNIRSGRPKFHRFHPILADFVVLDLKRPWYINDIGCNWYWGKCRANIQALKFELMVKRAMTHFDIMVKEDGLVILRRRKT